MSQDEWCFMAHSFKGLFKRAFFYLAPLFGAWFLRLIYFTCKKEFKGKPVDERGSIVVFWHGRLAMMSFVYNKFWRLADGRLKKAKVIISDHKDGEFIVRVISHFGIGTIRGSSSKGGARAVALALKELKSGTDVIITPDGPRGPRHSVAAGAGLLALKTKAPFYVLNYEASSYWQFSSWDAMILPKPFSKITFSLKKIELTSDESGVRREIMNALWRSSEDDGGDSVARLKEQYCTRLNSWANSLRKRKKPLLLDDEMGQISTKIASEIGAKIDISDPYGDKNSKNIDKKIQSDKIQSADAKLKNDKELADV